MTSATRFVSFAGGLPEPRHGSGAAPTPPAHALAASSRRSVNDETVRAAGRTLTMALRAADNPEVPKQHIGPASLRSLNVRCDRSREPLLVPTRTRRNANERRRRRHAPEMEPEVALRACYRTGVASARRGAACSPAAQKTSDKEPGCGGPHQPDSPLFMACDSMPAPVTGFSRSKK